jgi:hypothetical protein
LRGLALCLARPVLMAALLAACGTSTSGDSYCLLYDPIWTNASDTSETVRQAVRANAVYECVCLDYCG